MLNRQKDLNSFLRSKVGRPVFNRHVTKFNSSVNPMIIEEGQMNGLDIFSRLMLDRIIFLGDPITDEVANIVIAQLLWLHAEEKTKPIEMYINSPGGYIYSGLGICDTMQFIKNNIKTTVTGMAASMSAVIASCGTPGFRSALKNATFMIHQPSSGAEGQSSDMIIAANESQRLKARLCKILADNTGQTVEKITADSDRDYYMDVDAAKAYGLIDKII